MGSRAQNNLSDDEIDTITDIKYVQELENPFSCRHRPLQNVVVHRQRPDRVEEPLYKQDKSHHHSGFNRSVQQKKSLVMKNIVSR